MVVRTRPHPRFPGAQVSPQPPRQFSKTAVVYLQCWIFSILLDLKIYIFFSLKPDRAQYAVKKAAKKNSSPLQRLQKFKVSLISSSSLKTEHKKCIKFVLQFLMYKMAWINYYSVLQYYWILLEPRVTF